MLPKLQIIFKYFIIITVLISFFTLVCSPENTTDIKQIQGESEIYYGSENIKLTELNDPLFQNSEYLYNSNLAIKSYFLATSAFSSSESDKFWGEDKNCGRENSVKTALTDLGFTNLEFYGYDVSLNDTSSKVAFAIGKKTYSNDTQIVAVAVRGGNYGLEWADNFNVGATDFDYHLGFYSSAKALKDKVDKYISDNLAEKKIKFWITGYSRGGSVANILASMYDNQKESVPCEVYAYTFASPRCIVSDSLNSHDSLYDNIFNILSPNDPVYNIPPAKWGFGRFGTCVYFPEVPKKNTENKIKESYFKYTGTHLNISRNSINSFLNIIIKSAKSRDLYSKYLSESISDFIIIKMSKYKNENDEWVNYNTTDILKKMYGSTAIKTFDKIKNNDFFKSMERLEIYLPEDVYILLTLCTLNGYTGFENEIFSNLNVDDINDISYIASGDLISVCHSPLYYRSCLENTPLSELTFEKG